MNINFPKVSENFSLNFLNTRIVKHGKIIELLNNAEDFFRWIENEMCQEECSFQLKYLSNYFESLVDISEILYLREVIYLKIRGMINEQYSISDIQKWIETELSSQTFLVKFTKNKRILIPNNNKFEGFKAIIFLHLSDLVETGEIKKISSCSNPECVLLFVNTSGRRKWCSMKICGNRNKVERYEQRHK